MEQELQLKTIFGYILAIGLDAVMLVCIIGMAGLIYKMIKNN